MTHEASDLAENGGKRMKSLNYRAKAADQVPIAFPIVFELACFVLKQVENRLGRVATLKFVGESIICDIYPCLLGIIGQSIEKELKIRRGNGCCGCRGHESREGWRALLKGPGIDDS